MYRPAHPFAPRPAAGPFINAPEPSILFPDTAHLADPEQTDVVRTLAFLCIAAFSLGPAVRAVAAGVEPPPLEKGAKLTNARLINNQLELRDAETNAPIIMPRGWPVADGASQGVKWTVRMQEQPAGADLIIHYLNTTEQPRTLGSLNIGAITLGPAISYVDLRDYSRVVGADANTFITRAWTYPSELYSPAWVLSNDTYAVGVSLLYPLTEYQHDARLILASPRDASNSGEGGRGWITRFQMASEGLQPNQKLLYDATIGPGEVQTYVLSIRVTRTPKEWVRTLTPYRDFFRKLYGGVKYQRRASPVLAMTLAEESRQTDDNPAGLDEMFRPELRTIGPLTKNMRREMGDAGSLMLVNPTGLYRSNRAANPPFQFTTAWRDRSGLATVLDRYDGLPAVRKAGIDLGLWWGNSIRVANTWDPIRLAPLDTDNPDDLTLVDEELDLALKAGASTIMLGNYRHEIVPVWKLATHLEALHNRTPDTRFVTEPSACDVLHALAPTYIASWIDQPPPKTERDLNPVTDPNVMADFLLPGHETWIGFRYNAPRQSFRVEADSARVHKDMERIAALGYVPCFFWTGKLEGGVTVAATWPQSIPQDLHLADAPPPEPVAAPTQTAATPAAPAKPETTSLPPGTSKLLSKGNRVIVKPAPGDPGAPENYDPEEQRSLAREAIKRLKSTAPNAGKNAYKGKGGKDSTPITVVPRDNKKPRTADGSEPEKP